MSSFLPSQVADDGLAPREADKGRGHFHLLGARAGEAMSYKIQNHAGSCRLIQLALKIHRHPVQNKQIARCVARILRIGEDMFVMHHEKPRIKPPCAIGRGNRAGDEINILQRRGDAMGEIALPACMAGIWSVALRRADNQAGLLKSFANRGQCQPAQFIVADAFARLAAELASPALAALVAD